MPKDMRDFIGPNQDEPALYGFLFKGQLLTPGNGGPINWVMLTPSGDPEELNMKEVSLYAAGVIS